LDDLPVPEGSLAEIGERFCDAGNPTGIESVTRSWVSCSGSSTAGRRTSPRCWTITACN